MKWMVSKTRLGAGWRLLALLGAAPRGAGRGHVRPGGAVAGHEAIAAIAGTRRGSSGDGHSGARRDATSRPRPHLPLRPGPLPFPRRRSRTSWGRFAIPASIPISIRA